MVHIMKGNLKKLLIPPVMRESMRLTNCNGLHSPHQARRGPKLHISSLSGRVAYTSSPSISSGRQPLHTKLLVIHCYKSGSGGHRYVAGSKDLGSQLSIWEARRLGVWQVVYTRFLVKYQPWQGQSSTGFPHTIS